VSLNTTRLYFALTEENRPGDRQRLTSSPAETAYFVRERAERSDLMANRRRALTYPEEAEQVWPTDRRGCVSIPARKPYSRGHLPRTPSVEGHHTHWRSPVSNSQCIPRTAISRYSIRNLEDLRIVERHLKQVSMKAIHQDRSGSMSVDELEHNRRKSLKRGKSRPIDSSVTVPQFDRNGNREFS